RRQSAGAARKADVGRAAADGGRDVDRVARGEGPGRVGGVGDRLGEGGAVVGQADVERVAAVQIDTRGGQVHRTDIGRGGAVGVRAGGGVGPPLVVLLVELGGHALAEAAGAADVVRAVAEAAAGGAQGSRADPLEGEGDAVSNARPRAELEAKLGGELRDVHR